MHYSHLCFGVLTAGFLTIAPFAQASPLHFGSGDSSFRGGAEGCIPAGVGAGYDSGLHAKANGGAQKSRASAGAGGSHNSGLRGIGGKKPSVGGLKRKVRAAGAKGHNVRPHGGGKKALAGGGPKKSGSPDGSGAGGTNSKNGQYAGIVNAASAGGGRTSCPLGSDSGRQNGLAQNADVRGGHFGQGGQNYSSARAGEASHGVSYANGGNGVPERETGQSAPIGGTQGADSDSGPDDSNTGIMVPGDHVNDFPIGGGDLPAGSGATKVPEPSSIVLLGSALLGVAAAGRRKPRRVRK